MISLLKGGESILTRCSFLTSINEMTEYIWMPWWSLTKRWLLLSSKVMAEGIDIYAESSSSSPGLCCRRAAVPARRSGRARPWASYWQRRCTAAAPRSRTKYRDLYDLKLLESGLCSGQVDVHPNWGCNHQHVRLLDEGHRKRLCHSQDTSAKRAISVVLVYFEDCLLWTER